VILIKIAILILNGDERQGIRLSFFALSIACVRRRTSSFSNTFDECVLIVFNDTNKREAIS
jgi:hypothetical protein